MWVPDPWLQLHLLALCKNGLHSINNYITFVVGNLIFLIFNFLCSYIV